MKMSNKLLLIGFLTGLLLISAIHVSLYAKYKKGDYTLYHEEDRLRPGQQSFPQIKSVSFTNLPGVVVKFGGVTRIDTSDTRIEVTYHGNTLQISGKRRYDDTNLGPDLAINLPHNIMLALFNSSVKFTGSTQTDSVDVQLVNSSLASSDGKFGRLSITTDSASRISLSSNQLLNANIKSISH